MNTIQKPVHDNKPYNATAATANVIRDTRAKNATTKFLTSLGYTITDNLERYAKYDLAANHPTFGTVKIECEDRLIRDWTNMVTRSFDTFRIYKRKINKESEWLLYVATCGDDSNLILITTHDAISNSKVVMITNKGWGQLEPVYEVEHTDWVCYNMTTQKVEWGNNPIIMGLLGK